MLNESNENYNIMKILFISNVYRPYHVGGAELVVENFVKELSKRHKISIIATAPFKNIKSLGLTKEVEGPVTIYRFFPFNIRSILLKPSPSIIIKCIRQILDIWNIHSYLFIRHILLKERPDIIHIHCFAGFSNSIFTAIRHLRLKAILSLHDAHLLCPKAVLIRKNYNFCTNPSQICKIYQVIKKWFTKDISLVTFNSRFLSDLYQQAGFFTQAKKSTLLPIVQKPIKRNKKRSDKFHLLFVGRLNKQKGADLLIESFRKIDNKKISLALIGRIDEEVYFRKLASGDDRIHLCGQIPHHRIDEHYRQADIVIVPSRCFEALSLVVLESYRHGIPVIATKIGGLTDMVQDGFNGLTFESGNPLALRDAILNAINNPDLLFRFSQNIEGGFISELSAEKVMNNLENLYSYLLCQKPKRSS